MARNSQTAVDLVARIRNADAAELEALERALAADTRVTVRRALAAARKRIDDAESEQQRVRGMYDFDAAAGSGGLVMGLDEVGRGPLAGPLTVGAVVLPATPLIAGLNDSKQLGADMRQQVAALVREHALAWATHSVEASYIDRFGMTASLRHAFGAAIQAIDKALAGVGTVLIDGNPLHIDQREVNVIKGDARSACIAAASIIAKVERDAFMREQAQLYPAYGFERNKGYASAQHQQAIRNAGLCPLHRATFCSSLIQDSLF